jgi:hypothetical protein
LIQNAKGENMGFGTIFIIVIIGIGWLISASKKSPKNIENALNSSSKIISFSTNVDKLTTLKIIIGFAQRNGYKVDSFDENQYNPVLSDSISATTWGFFYPIDIETSSDGSTIVKVGIKSKVIQVGPIVSRSLEKCTNGIKVALFSNTNEKLCNDI